MALVAVVGDLHLTLTALAERVPVSVRKTIPVQPIADRQKAPHFRFLERNRRRRDEKSRRRRCGPRAGRR